MPFLMSLRPMHLGEELTFNYFAGDRAVEDTQSSSGSNPTDLEASFSLSGSSAASLSTRTGGMNGMEHSRQQWDEMENRLIQNGDTTLDRHGDWAFA